MINGRSKYNVKANEVVQRAMLCKLMRVSPKELDEMDWDDVELLSAVYAEVAKKNPMALFM